MLFRFMKLDEKRKLYDKRNNKKEMTSQIIKLVSTLHIHVLQKFNEMGFFSQDTSKIKVILFHIF